MGTLMFACGREAASVEKPTPVKGSTGIERTGWEQQWETVLAQGKREGTVSIYSMMTPKTREAVSKVFTAKYGISLEFTPFARGADHAAKVRAENSAGLYLVDAHANGNPTLLPIMKPDGLLGPIRPLLILPEVLEPNAWIGHKLPFTDEDGMALMMISSVMRSVIINTDMVKEGEITSYKDVLKPQYKGKIVLNDPSIAGGSNAILAHLGENVWGQDETLDFLRRLVKDQQAVIQRDHRQHVEWIARGKYAIGIAPLREAMLEFLTIGAPIKLVPDLKEENRVSPSTGVLAVPAKFAHPNAAKVFVNWLLTKEGQSVFATSFGAPSTRADASTEGIDPLVIPKPGVEYYFDTEKDMPIRTKWEELAKRTVDEVMK